MYIKKKVVVRAVLSLTAIITVFSALLGIAVSAALENGGPVILLIIAASLIITAFITAFLLFMIYIEPMMKFWHRDEQRSSLQTKTQFADFMDDLPLGVFIKNSDIRYVYLNKYMDKVFGKSNCLNKTPYNIYDREIAERIMLEDKRVLAGENIMVEEVVSDKNGKERVYMTHKFLMQDDRNNKQIGGISIEITLRREAEYKLRILSKAIRNSPVCVLITDPEGNIEYVNPAFVNTTGYSFAEVMGKNMNIINSGKHDESFFRDMWERIKSGDDWQGEILNRKKDGSLFWEFVSISSIDNQKGGITHFVAIKDDISNRKLIEEARIRAKEKAEENDRLKSAFLANMSHEIRTPMNAIVGLSGLLSDPELPLAEKENFSAIIKENSDVLLQLIDDIVDISKIEAGQITMRTEICDINALLVDIYDSFKLQVKDKEDELQFILNRENFPAELHTYTDAKRLRQVITNLLCNALKFTDKGKIEIGSRLEGKSNILLFVKDTGIGIRKEKQEMIFDRFGQVDDSNTKNYRGAGLGLSISKSLVELLGGSIRVESSEGQGSCFSVKIPYQPAPDTKTKPDNSPRTTIRSILEGKKILVVEKLEVNFNLIKTMLRKTGAKILWARTGKQSLDICKKDQTLSLVLLDPNLPDITGLNVLGNIHKINPELPVIIQTSYAMNGEKERYREAGCDGYITKPIQTEHLMEAIRYCMEKK